MAWYTDPDRKIRADIPPTSSIEVKILGTIGPIFNLDDPKTVHPKSIQSTTATVEVSSNSMKTFNVPITAASAKFYKVRYGKTTTSSLTSITSFN
jgi:hypothetical protein